jgi:dTDP-4-dehydrorhamnose reductase
VRKRRVLVLGGSGWIGRAAVPILTEAWDVASYPSADLDVTSLGALRDAIDDLRPDAVLNLAARNPPAADDAMARVNSAGAASAAVACSVAGVRLVHVSTDLVLDGRSAPYADDAPARPLSAYGRTKAGGEAAVIASHGRSLVVRTSLVVDEREPDRFTRACLEKLARGESVDLFTDEIRCPLTRTAFARALAELLASDVAGRLNVAGAEAISRYDLGVRLLRRFGATDLSLVRPALAAERTEPRPLDLTLDVTRAQSLLAAPLPAITSVL